MKIRFVLTLALLAAIFLPGVPAAHAMMLFTVTQSGSNVVVSASGTFNLAGLTKGGNDSANASVIAEFANLAVGPTTAAFDYTSISGPTDFGTTFSMRTLANTSTGTGFGVDGSNHALFLPQTYVSGAAISGTGTFNNQTLASLGITPGTYTFTWGTGANADSLTILAGVPAPVPEPSTWALLGVGVAGLGVVTLRRRAAHA